MARSAVLQDPKDRAKIVKLRDNEGRKWSEIAAEFGVSEGRVMFAYLVETSEPVKGKVTNDTIVKLRNNGDSWGIIAAKTNLPEGRVRSMWQEATGKSALGERIGKGGRHPGINGTGREAVSRAAKAAAGKKPASKPSKNGAAPARAGGVTKSLHDALEAGTLNKEILETKITGKVLRVDNKGKVSMIEVGEVKKYTNGVVTVVDSETGGSRAVKIATITGVAPARR